SRQLVARETVTQQFREPSWRGERSVVSDEQRCHHFAEARGRGAEDANGSYWGQCQKRCLDFERIDVFAAADDHVVAAPAHVELTPEAELAAIGRKEPAVAVDAGPTFAEVA